MKRLMSSSTEKSRVIPPPVPRTVWALGLVSFFMDVSSEIVHALLPLFLTTTLGASVALVGLIDGVAESTASISKIFSGYLSDRMGRRKPLILFGYSLGAMSKPLFALAGGPSLVFFARFADRIGKETIAIIAMVVSGSGAIATALTFGGPVWLTVICILVWGAAILPDSAQFSALVADHSPDDKAGSLMTFQTALGFALTFLTVQATPVLADQIGWPGVFVLMAIGPAFGVVAMLRLKAMPD